MSSPTGTTAQTIGRVTLGAFMIFAGVGHLTFGREEFRAQVPEFVPLPPDVTVLASGAVEIALGLAMILVRNRDAFGLTSDRARLVRLFFQPVLIAWALWSTGAWRLLTTRTGRG